MAPQNGPKDPSELEKYSREWWKEWAIIFTVFSITGSSSMKITRPVVTYLAGEGTFFGGPWYFTLAYLLCTMPICGFFGSGPGVPTIVTDDLCSKTLPRLDGFAHNWHSVRTWKILP